jgi:signal peptidase I
MTLGVSGIVLLVAMLAACGAPKSSSGPEIRTLTQPATTETIEVPSSSMEPTLHCAKPGAFCEAPSADLLIVRVPTGSVSRGDVVVFKTPPKARLRCGAGGTFVKRLIGLPGETVRETKGRIYINDQLLSETYIRNDRRDRNPTQVFKVPKGEYFMIGDNRQQSCDSRSWGSVPRRNLIGEVVRVDRPAAR